MLSKNLEIKYGEALICLVCTIKNSDKIIFLYFIKNHIGHLTKKKYYNFNTMSKAFKLD